MEESRKSLDPRQLGETIRKRKWHLVLPLVALAGLSVFFIERLPIVYRVESTVLFEDRAPLSGEVERHLLPGTRSSRNRRSDRMEEANILRMKILSPEFLGMLAGEMGFLDDPERLIFAREKKERTGDPKSAEEILLQDVTGWFARMVGINLAGPEIYQISLEGANRELLYDLSNRINSKLFDLIQGEQISLLEAAADFTDGQILIYKGKVDEAEAELERFISRQPIAPARSVYSTVDPAVASRLAEETGFEILRIQERERNTTSILSLSYGFDPDGFSEQIRPAVGLYEERLQSLERQLGMLLLERSWNDPTVIAHNTRIGEAHDELDGAIRRNARNAFPLQPSRLQDLAADAVRDRILIGALEMRKRTLLRQSRPRGSGTDPGMLVRRDQEMQFLEDQVRINEEIYRSFVRQATSTKISEAVETEQLSRRVQVLNPPRWPRKPISPSKPQLYGLAVVLGLAVGIVALMIAEYVDTSVKDVNDVEEIVGAPILGTIPMIEYRYLPEESRGRSRRVMVAAVVGCLLVVAAAGWFLLRGGEETTDESEGEPVSAVRSEGGNR